MNTELNLMSESKGMRLMMRLMEDLDLSAHLSELNFVSEAA